MDFVVGTGTSVRDVVLAAANLLRQEFVPGLVSLVLLSFLVLCTVKFASSMRSRVVALNRVAKQITRHRDAAELSASITEVDRNIAQFGTSGAKGRVAAAWREFRETLVPHDEGGQVILRNSVRPSAFFNIEDLGFSAGFWRYVPSLFVSVGLLLTFLGLVSALQSIVPEKGGAIGNDQLSTLLSVASAKFIMSLTGLLCSILFTLVLRFGTARAEMASHYVANEIEGRLSFISLEYLAIEQLSAIREQREHFRRIGLELVAELGRPLREDIPRAISIGIETAMAPLLAQVGRAGAEGVGALVEDLSSRFTSDVSQALGAASDRLSEAGDRIAQLSERMDSSSTRVGQELDGAISRIAKSMEAIQSSLSIAAASTGSVFSEGAEKLLTVMNSTLESIQNNTSIGAQALSSAAADLKQAGAAFRQQMDEAARDGGAVARASIEATGTRIARLTDELTSKATEQLMSPLGEIAGQMQEVANQVAGASADLRILSDGVRSGADATVEAAGAFRLASRDLVDASTPVRTTTERMEGSLRQLADITRNTASTITKSAEATARSAADVLTAAQAVLASKAQAIDATLDGVSVMLDRLKGQGDRIDDIDVKLGRAFDAYTTQVADAVTGMRHHVQELQERLAPALDTLQIIVGQAEQFAPQSVKMR
ncbi:methyl-accepting chemotaxis protein [Bradyrhizobium diazoefficiens]